VSEFHAETPKAIASEGLAEDPYVAGRAGLEPTTLRTNLPMSHHAHHDHMIMISYDELGSFARRCDICIEMVGYSRLNPEHGDDGGHLRTSLTVIPRGI